MREVLRNKTLQIATFLSLLVVTGTFLYGQAGAGAISGTVTDTTGAVVTGTKVTITNEATAVSRVVTTDDSGFYSVRGFLSANTGSTFQKPASRRTSQVRYRSTQGSAAQAVLCSKLAARHPR